MLRADLARDPSFLNRFRREAQSAAALNHPAIVAVYDTGEDQWLGRCGHVPYIVMEYVEGQTLRDVLKSRTRCRRGAPWKSSPGSAARWTTATATGIVHRDIKPANVMLARAGEVKVMDFGIARAVAETRRRDPDRGRDRYRAIFVAGAGSR